MSSKQDDILNRLEDIDNSFLLAMEDDERLRSGVPERQRTTDLDFIQMTGLTRRVPEEDTAVSAEPAPAWQAAASALSFFEKGVVDVDAEMAPHGLEQAGGLNQDIVPEPAAVGRSAVPTPSLAGLKEVIEELAREEAALPKEADDAPSSELSITEALPEEEPEAVPAEPMTVAAAAGADIEPGMPSSMFGEIAEQAAVISATPEEFPALEPVGWVSDENPKEDALATEGKEGFVPLADAGSPELEVFAKRPSRPAVEHMLDLAEAEQLLQALESQSREPVPAGTAERAHGDAPSSVEADASGTALDEVAPVEEPDADEENGASVYRQPMSRRHRHRSSHSRQRGWRRVVRWGTRLAVILAVACIAAGGYLKFRSMFAGPKETFERAQSLQMAGRYGEASGAYQRFAQSNPNDPQRAEAEFLSAYCLQLAPADSFDAKQTNNALAHDLFARFVADNPAHAKVPRARVRMGILSFEMGRYEEAIEILQDPTLPMSDPEGALPALRTLARARWKLGQYAEATSAYQQAASLTGNYTADQDYEELGDLSRWRADRTENAEQQRRLQMDAVDNWAKALRMPTADPAAKGRVREKRRWLLEQLGLLADEAGQGYQAAGPAKTVPASGPRASLERTAAAATTAEQENAPSPSVPSLEQNPAAPDSATTSTSGAPDPNAEAHYPGQPVAPEKTEPNATAPGRSPS